MIAADTSILLRYILRDDIVQTAKATRFIEETVSEDGAILINRIVLCEVAWVLRQSYRLPKPAIIEVLESLLGAHGLIIDAEDEARQALHIYRHHNVSFADAFISTSNRLLDAAPTYTFDKKAAALPEFRLLK